MHIGGSFRIFSGTVSTGWEKRIIIYGTWGSNGGLLEILLPQCWLGRTQENHKQTQSW